MREATTKQTAFRLYERDLEILDEAQRAEGFNTRTETLRFVLREWARGRSSEPKRKRTGPRR